MPNLVDRAVLLSLSPPINTGDHAELFRPSRSLRYGKSQVLDEISSGDNAMIEAETVRCHRHRSIQDLSVTNIAWMHRLDRASMLDDDTFIVAKSWIECFSCQRNA